MIATMRTHALTYQGITALTGAADDSQWGSATPDPHGRGRWLTGTRNTGGTGCVADCKTMDTAFVPLNAMTHPSAWHVQLGVLPAGEGYDLGTVVSMSHVSGHGWVAYTKRNPGTTCDMQPQFTDLPIGSPPPRTDGPMGVTAARSRRRARAALPASGWRSRA